MTILLIRTSWTTPPRPRCVFRRMPRSVPSKTQLLMTTFFTPPDISLPITTPPCPASMVKLVIVIFSQGLFTRRPSSSLPHLIAMQSSPTSMWQFEIRTFRHESGLIPSVFGESFGLIMVRSCTVTFSQYTGFTVQAGEFLSVTPSMSTFLQR